MHAVRLRSVIDLILTEHTRLGIEQKIAQVIETLGTCVDEPSAASDEKFRSALTGLLAALRRSRTNDFVESDRRILLEMQGERFTGHGLGERILGVANQRPFLAGEARERMSEIADEIQRFITATVSAQTAFERLNVNPRRLASDQFELGILLPDSVIKGDLDRLINELKEWSQVLGELVPALCGAQPDVSLRVYSTRRFEFAAPLDHRGAMAMGTIIARIYDMFGKVKQNRDRATELERGKYPHAIVGRIKEYEQEIVTRELKAIRETVTARFLKKEEGKGRTLDRVLDRALRFLAVKIRDGAAVELIGPQVAEAAATRESAPTHHVRAALEALRKGAVIAPIVDGKVTSAADEPKAPTLPLSKIAGDEEEAEAA